MLARPSKFLPLQKGALPPSNTVIKYFNITDILIFIITQARAWKLVKQHYVYRQATLHVEILRLQNFLESALQIVFIWIDTIAYSYIIIYVSIYDKE